MTGVLLTLGWAAVGAAAAWGLWILFVHHHYRVRAEPPALIRATARDGWRIALHVRKAATRRYAEPVLLSHGLASNRYTFDFEPPYSVAHVLADAGFDCYSVEWRGSGHSTWPPFGRPFWGYDVDDYINLDAPAAVARVLEESGASQLLWVGHSMGALIGYAVAQTPLAARLKGLVALGAPVFFPYDPLLHFATRVGATTSWPFGVRQRLMSLTLAPFLGRVTIPLSDVVINPQHIPPPIQRKVYARMISGMGHGVLVQFRDWVQHDAFRSSDGRIDYRAGLASVTVPLLVMGGSVDRLATPRAVQGQYELAGSADKTLVIFGAHRGDALDYGHGDLLFGTGAPKEIHPLLVGWLRDRATLVG